MDDLACLAQIKCCFHTAFKTCGCGCAPEDDICSFLDYNERQGASVAATIQKQAHQCSSSVLAAHSVCSIQVHDPGRASLTMVWLLMVNCGRRVDTSHTVIVLSLLALAKRKLGRALCAGSQDCEGGSMVNMVHTGNQMQGYKHGASMVSTEACLASFAETSRCPGCQLALRLAHQRQTHIIRSHGLAKPRRGSAYLGSASLRGYGKKPASHRRLNSIQDFPGCFLIMFNEFI
eukprot:1150287-Pelagomonas_calceolata.AAC.4